MSSAWAAAFAAISGALITALGFLLSQRQKRRENLDGRVKVAVSAALGEKLFDFIKLGEQTATSISELTSNAEQRAREVFDNVENMLGELSKGEEALVGLRDALAAAQRLIPGLEEASNLRPAALLRQIEMTSPDSLELLALLSRLLTVEGASSRQLEKAGDEAREKLDDTDLARLFYEKALVADPDNISARAELLVIRAKPGSGDYTRDLRELALQYPRETTPLVKLLNEYVDRDEYAQMKEDVLLLLEEMPDNPLLWRNLSIARAETGESQDAVSHDYDRAIELSRRPTSSSEGDFVNTVRSYSNWLIATGQFERARELIAEALERMPSEGSLYFAIYKLEMRAGNRQRARRALQLMGRFGNPNQGYTASRLLEGIDGLDYLDSEEPGGTD